MSSIGRYVRYVSYPLSSPGTAIARPPTVEDALSYMLVVVAAGARSRALSTRTRPEPASYTVARKPPPSPMHCAHPMPSQKSVAIAASTALPFFSRIELEYNKKLSHCEGSYHTFVLGIFLTEIRSILLDTDRGPLTAIVRAMESLSLSNLVYPQ